MRKDTFLRRAIRRALALSLAAVMVLGLSVTASATYTPPFDVSAEAALLVNLNTGDIIYEKNADLVAIGAYKAGSNRKLDFALSKIDAVNGFLTQGVDESFSYEACIRQMREILK